MKNSNTEYLIFNKATYEYITTYYNENTLKTLDLERCYYTIVNKVKPKQTKQVLKYQTEVNYDRKSSSSVSSISNNNNSSYDTSLINPINVFLYTSLSDDSSDSSGSYNNCDTSSSSSSYSDSASGYSSSSSSDSSYSSSSCSSDSGSW